MLKDKQVEWVVNDISELGVKIGDQFFFMYKGRSLVYENGKHDNDEPMKWRHIGKREFGECCHPWTAIELKQYGSLDRSRPVRLPETYIGYHDGDQEEWYNLPTSQS